MFSGTVDTPSLRERLSVYDDPDQVDPPPPKVYLVNTFHLTKM